MKKQIEVYILYNIYIYIYIYMSLSLSLDELRFGPLFSSTFLGLVAISVAHQEFGDPAFFGVQTPWVYSSRVDLVVGGGRVRGRVGGGGGAAEPLPAPRQEAEDSASPGREEKPSAREMAVWGRLGGDIWGGVGSTGEGELGEGGKIGRLLKPQAGFKGNRVECWAYFLIFSRERFQQVKKNGLDPGFGNLGRVKQHGEGQKRFRDSDVFVFIQRLKKYGGMAMSDSPMKLP